MNEDLLSAHEITFLHDLACSSVVDQKLEENTNYTAKRSGPSQVSTASSDVRFLNVSSEPLMELAQASLAKNIAVPFGAEISVDTDQQTGLCNHEMLLIGYNLKTGQTKPEKFCVENSWGPLMGDRGMFTLYREGWTNVSETSIRADLLSESETALCLGPSVTVKHDY